MTSYIGIFLLFFTTSNAFIFPENKTLTYDYHAILQIGATEPSLLTSKFEIFAEIQTTKIEKGTHFQLKQITYVEGEEIVQDKISPLPEANAINYPFVFYLEDEFDDGGISVDPKDEVWSINMKRSIATLFQIDEKIVEELNEINKVVDGADNSGFGKCKTTYTLLPSTKGHLEFSKRIVYTTCPSFVWSLDTSILGNADDCGNSPNIMQRAYIERTYDLINGSDGVYVNSIRSDNNILNSVVKDEHFVVVDQMVKLKSVEDRIVQELKIDEMVIKPLEFEKQYETNGLYDLTGGRRNIDLVEVKKDAKIVLSSVYNHVRFHYKDISDEDESENAIVLIEKLKQLNEESLYELYMELEDSVKDMYLTTLPLLGTKASLMTIHKLIKEKLVEVDIAVKMLQGISFHIKKPEALFVESLMEFVKPESGYDKSIRNAAILSVSALLKSPPVLFYYTKMKEEDFSEHIDYFITKMKNATEIEDRLVYMSALMNIQNKNVTEFLNSMVRNENSTMELTPHLRSLAMFGVLKHMKNAWRLGSRWKLDELLPIFFDRNEDFEVRSTALFMVLNYGSPREILTLFWFMKTEKNQKFQRIFYTALDSFSLTTRDCHKMKLKPIQYLIAYTPKPKIPSAIDSLLTHYDYFDSLKKYGSSLNVAIFVDQNDTMFQSIYLKYSFSLNDYSFDQHAIYLHEYNDPSYEIRESKTIPIEIIIFRNNFAVNAFVTSKQEVRRYIESIDEAFDYPLSYEIHQNLGSELVVASDIGVPIAIYLKKPNARMLQLRTKIKERLTYNLTFNLWDRGEYGLKIYNPMADSWHGVQRIHTLDLKFHADMERKSNDLILKLMDENTSPLGFKSSIHTEIFIDDGKVKRNTVVPDKKRSTNIGKIWSYDDPNTGLVYFFEIAGCGFNGAFKIDQIKKFFIPDQRNWGERFWTKLLVMAQYIWDTISVFPGAESCKVMLKIKQSEKYPMTHYVTKITIDTSEENPKIRNTHLIFKGINEDKTIKEFKIDVLKGEVENGNESLDISIQNVISGAANPTIYVNSSRNIWSDGTICNWSIQKGLMTVPGHLDEVECSLNISMIGKLSEEQKIMQNLENVLYEKCSDNPANKMRECVQKLSALRSYEYDISYYPESTSIYFMNAFKLLMGKYFKRLERTNESVIVEKGKMKVSMLYPLVIETVDVSLIDDRQSFIIKNIPIDEFPIGGEPINTFSFSDDPIQNYCEFTVHDLWNWLQVKVDKFELESKWTKMIDLCPDDANCYNNMTVEAKRINQTEDLMALRVIVNKEILDIHINDKVEMYVNDKPLVIFGDSRYHSIVGTDIMMFEDDLKVLLHIKNPKVNIEFTGSRVLIALDFPVVGLCF